MGTNLPHVYIKRDFMGLGTTDVVPFSLGTKFLGSTICPTPPHDDTVIATESNKLLGIHDGRQIAPGKTVTANEQVQLNIIKTMLSENADYAEPLVNKAAAAGGDYNIAIAAITALGFTWYMKEGHKRGEGFVDDGIGWVHIHEPNIVDTPEIHYFEYGAATAINTDPTSTKVITLPVGDAIFTGIKSTTIFAYRHAFTTTVSKKSGTTPTTPVTPSLGKVVSTIPVSKSKHPVIDFNNGIQLEWGPWHFLMIR